MNKECTNFDGMLLKIKAEITRCFFLICDSNTKPNTKFLWSGEGGK